jgi:hypothetical protein
VTHDLARAAALATASLVLMDGRVAWQTGARADAGSLERAYREALGAVAT